MKRIFATLVGSALTVGCVSSGTPGSASFSTGPAATVAASPQGVASRTINFEVRALGSLADSSGKILNSMPSAIVAAGGGNIVAAGGGNLVAAGGSNIVAAGGGNLSSGRTLAAATTAQAGFVRVGSAVIHLETLDGKHLSNDYLEASATGQAAWPNVLRDKPLIAVAQWEENGQVYRTSAIISTDTTTAVIQLDPINQFIQARVRGILSANGVSAALSASQLDAVWDAFNDAGVTLPVSLLQDGTTLDDLQNFYKNSLCLLSAPGRVTVLNYMQMLGAPPSSSASSCPAATGTP